MGFNTKVVQFWMFWGYPHFRKPPFMMRKEKSYQMSEISDVGNSKSLACRDMYTQQELNQLYNTVLCVFAKFTLEEGWGIYLQKP
jgi:hypothetical protein